RRRAGRQRPGSAWEPPRGPANQPGRAPRIGSRAGRRAGYAACGEVPVLITLLSLALAAPVSGRVTLQGVGVMDARVEVIDATGQRTSVATYTDRKGRFALDASEGSTLAVRRVVRDETGLRTL